MTNEFAPLIDMRGADLRALATQEDGRTGQVLSRLLANIEDEDGVLSAFQSFASS